METETKYEAARRGLLEAEAARTQEIAELRAALEPFAHFARQYERHPFTTHGTLYAIHAGKDGAEIRLADLQHARDVLDR